MIYLDYVSTTPLNEEVKKGYLKILDEHFANGDSLYALGMKANALQEKARSMIAETFKVKQNEIIFTSGASEANNMAIKGVCFNYQNRGKHIITTCLEHSSVYNTFLELQETFGYEVDFITLDETNHLDIKMLEDKIRDDTILVSTMYVNNEVGIINDIKKISEIIRNKNPKTKYHIDCVQALAKFPIDLSLCDLASFSAHKINGLKGSGILYKKSNCNLRPLINGGQQEYGLRGGTSNIATNTMFYKTLRLALTDVDQHFEAVKQLNQYLRSKLCEEVVILSDETCSPYIMSISLPYYKPEVVLHYLESKEIYISTKSTCSSKSDVPSHTVENMHIEEIIKKSVIRVSLSHTTTKEEIDTFVETLHLALKELKKQGA